MQLARASQYANAAARMRAITLARGTSCQGYPLWTEAEDDICRKFYPDYDALISVLPRRTRCAVKTRCVMLKITNQKRPWTGTERSRLRKMYRMSSREELRTAFPDRSHGSLTEKAREIGVCRAKQPYVPTGDPLLDELRSECFRQKISMPDLDVIARARSYFKQKSWRGLRGCLKMNIIVRAIRELGGTVHVEWDRRDDY